jgi:hypothetical protein
VSFINRLVAGPPVYEEGRDVVIDQTLAVAQPEDNQSTYLQTLYGPIAAGAIAEFAFALVVDLPPGAVAIRINAAELGVVATPGTLRVALTGSS